MLMLHKVTGSQEKIMLNLKGPSPSSEKSIFLEFARLSGKSYGAVILFCTLGISLGRTQRNYHLALITYIFLLGCLFHKEETPPAMKDKEKRTEN